MNLLKTIGSFFASVWLHVHAFICRVLNPLQIRGIVIKLILPWQEGLFIYPIDYGHDSVTNTSYFTWLCIHARIIWPFPVPKVAISVPPVATAAPVIAPPVVAPVVEVQAPVVPTDTKA